MKRTAEITLGIIGCVFYLFSIAIGALRIWAEGNKDYLYDFMADNQAEMGVTSQDMNTMKELLSYNIAGGGALLVILPILAIILGIVAMFLLKGNRSPMLAGIIFIVVGVVYVILTGGGGILSGILFLIAGILCLARKPKTMLEE